MRTVTHNAAAGFLIWKFIVIQVLQSTLKRYSSGKKVHYMAKINHSPEFHQKKKSTQFNMFKKNKQTLA